MSAWDDIFNVEMSDSQGLVAVGGEWGCEILWQAYLRGCFPWPQPDLPILWFSPDPRGILRFENLKINKSLQKILRSHSWKIQFNKNFRAVMNACAQTPRPDQSGTWILPEMLGPYEGLFNAKKALCCEVLNQSGELVGGIYGVLTPHYFSAESMFYKESNASKVALVSMVTELKHTYGLDWMDIQMLTPATEALGGEYIDRKTFLKWIGQ